MIKSEVFPSEFLDRLPLPLLVAKLVNNTLNYPNVFLNQRFLAEIGWSLDEIPDKNTWWQTAYPDRQYQKVVERQWELAMITARESGQNVVSLDVNIMTKFRDLQRYNVFTPNESELLPGFLVIALVKLSE